MERNKDGNRPTFILELKDFNIRNIVYSLIDMFSVFCWDGNYKNPTEDDELEFMLGEVQEYINEEYIIGEDKYV